MCVWERGLGFTTGLRTQDPWVLQSFMDKTQRAKNDTKGHDRGVDCRRESGLAFHSTTSGAEIPCYEYHGQGIGSELRDPRFRGALFLSSTTEMVFTSLEISHDTVSA